MLTERNVLLKNRNKTYGLVAINTLGPSESMHTSAREDLPFECRHFYFKAKFTHYGLVNRILWHDIRGATMISPF
jgi:hypothetical protein